MLRLDWNLLFTIINLIVLYLLMKKFLFKPVQNIIAQRQEEVDKHFAEAAQKGEKANALKTQYEESLKGVDEARAKALEEARDRANGEYSRIVSEADAKAKEIVSTAKITAENEKNQILKKAESEITDMVVNATAKVVGVKSDSESDRALYDQFLGKAGE